MKNKIFSLTPIGGVGEIGSNFTLIEHNNFQIIIDFGILFPYDDFYDINYLIADTSYLNSDKNIKLFVTHGHEDHIGAIPHLIKQFPQLEIFASPFSAYLIRKKCSEFNLSPKIKIYREGDCLQFDQIEFNPVHVNHSIPETFGVVIRDSQKKFGVLFISDFKVDLTSTHERPINITRMQDLLNACEKKVALLDSTNVLLNKKTEAEDELIPDLEEIISSHEKRIFITLFSSNIHRIENILKLTKKYNKRITTMGRSVKSYIEAGIETDHISCTSDDFILPETAKEFNDRLVVLVSGCQGDYKSALRRLAVSEDPNFKLKKGDIVVFSSKVIPGNEKKISRIYNDITATGAEIITAKDKLIHASGHPAQQDLSILLEKIPCDLYFPIHGETFFLKRHVEFISRAFPHIEAHALTNFTQINFCENLEVKTKKIDPKEPIIIHGNMIEIERTKISERRKLACQGLVIVSMIPNKNQITTTTMGLPDKYTQNFEKLNTSILAKYNGELRGKNNDYIQQELKTLIRQYFNHLIGYKPVTQIHIFDHG